MRRRVCQFFGLLLLGCAGVAQCVDQLPGGRSIYVEVAPVAPVQVAPGKSSRVYLDFRVAPGFHINSNHPRDTFLIPTVLKLTPPTNIMVGNIGYPPGEDLSFQFMPDEKLSVYTGDFSVSAVISPTPTVSPGKYRVHGTLKYQACDDRQCYPSKEVPVEFDVKVSVRKASQPRQNPGQSPHVHSQN